VSTVPAVGSGRRREARAISRKHRELFLARLAAGFSVAASAAPTGRARQRFYEERAVDSEFAEAWRHAWEAGQDAIEDELLRAATEGWVEVEEVFEKGELVRRVERQRKNPALLAKLERKRTPETSPLVEVNLSPVQTKPVGPEDFLAVLRDSGQMHQLRQMHPAMVRYAMPHLTPAELEAFASDVVDAEALELPAGGGGSSPESRNPASSAPPPSNPHGRGLSESRLDRSTDPGGSP
jgi:hypothetical protein